MFLDYIIILAAFPLQSFLLLEERSVLEAPTQLNILNIGRPQLPDNVSLEFENYTASWAKDNLALTLDTLSFTVQKVSK